MPAAKDRFLFTNFEVQGVKNEYESHRYGITGEITTTLLQGK